MEHIDCSSSADCCVIMLYGSDLALIVLSVRFPAALDISWTVSCMSRLSKACLKILQSFGQCHIFAFFLSVPQDKQNTLPHEVQKLNYCHM